MKRKYRLHFKMVDGYEPPESERDRDYDCLSLILPGMEDESQMKTLCVDSKVYRKIRNKLDAEGIARLNLRLHDIQIGLIASGEREGTIEIMA